MVKENRWKSVVTEMVSIQAIPENYTKENVYQVDSSPAKWPTETKNLRFQLNFSKNSPSSCKKFDFISFRPWEIFAKTSAEL